MKRNKLQSAAFHSSYPRGGARRVSTQLVDFGAIPSSFLAGRVLTVPTTDSEISPVLSSSWSHSLGHDWFWHGHVTQLQPMRHKGKLTGASGKEFLTGKRHRDALCLLPLGHYVICRGCLGYRKYFWVMMTEEKDRKTVGFDGMDELLNYLAAEFWLCEIKKGLIVCQRIQFTEAKSKFPGLTVSIQ